MIVADECPLYLSSNTSLSAAICSCVIRVTRTRYPVPVPVPVPVPGSRWLVTILTNDAAVSPDQPRAPPATSAGFGTYLVDNVDIVDSVDVVDIPTRHHHCKIFAHLVWYGNLCAGRAELVLMKVFANQSVYALFEVCSKLFRFRYLIIITGAELSPHFSLTTRYTWIKQSCTLPKIQITALSIWLIASYIILRLNIID